MAGSRLSDADANDVSSACLVGMSRRLVVSVGKGLELAGLGLAFEVVLTYFVSFRVLSVAETQLRQGA